MKIDILEIDRFNPHRDIGVIIEDEIGFICGNRSLICGFGGGIGLGYGELHGSISGNGFGFGYYDREHEKHCYSLVWRKIK